MSAAETALRRVLDNFNSDRHGNEITTLQALNSHGANYTSALFAIKITPKIGEDLKLFAKVANANRELREIMNMRRLFEIEQYVYSSLADIYERLQQKHNLAPEHRFSFPIYYGGDDTDGEEVIILEDLTSKGYKPYSRFKSIDWDHISSCIKDLAKFHALSFAFAKEDPDNFAKASEILKFQYKENTNDPAVKQTWAKMLDAAVQTARKEHKDNITKLLDPDIPLEEVYKFRMPLSTPVFCHGDFRISNILIKKQNDSIETMVVDYQTVHVGCPAVDLLYLEFMGTDEEFRRENHERMIDYYFEKLAQSLERLDVDVNEVYPRETFDKELREMLPEALRTASFILPLVLVEVDRAPKLEDGGVENFAISPTQQFAERYSGLISDCVRWGAI